MRLRFLPLSLLIICIAVGSVNSANVPTTIPVEQIKAIQTQLLNDHFDMAEKLADKLIAQDSSSPVGYLFKAGARLAAMVNNEEPYDKDQFDQLLNKADWLADLSVTDDDSVLSAWMYLFKGHADVYRSLYESKFGSTASAIKRGMNARSDYEIGLSYDSTLYDLYFGIGGYHYWKSAKAGILRWIGLFKNEKEQGIDELHIASDSSLISKTSSRSALAYIYINEEQYDSAIAIIDQIRSAYPEGHTLLWPRGEALFKARRYAESLEVYRSLYERLKPNPGNYYNLIESAFFITRCYEELGMKKEMQNFAAEVTYFCFDLPKKMRNKRRAELAYLSRVARL